MPWHRTRLSIIWVIPTFCRVITTEAAHHAIKPHPRHRRHHNQQSRENQSQTQLLGSCIGKAHKGFFSSHKLHSLF